MTNFLHGNNKFVTIHNKCLKIPPSISMCFATLCEHQIQTALSQQPSSLTISDTITSQNIDLSSWITLYICPLYGKCIVSRISFASPVFLIHVLVAISYRSSHNVMFPFWMNIMYLLNYNNHPTFSILSCSNSSINVKVKFSLYMQWRHTRGVEV
jgi:hypothetical protein